MASTTLICVVDDQADYRFLLQQVFNRYFPAYPVRFFESGNALLDKLTELNPKPSLILLDRHMPHFDGHQTLLSLKGSSAYKRIPVVMMSADASGSEVKRFYEVGAKSSLIKPTDFSALTETLLAACQYASQVQ